MTWESEDKFQYNKSLSDYDMFNCNTRKDRDKRVSRHSFGVFIGCWPCGVVTMFDELFGSEGIRQVYALVIEWLATLKEEDRKKIR